MRPQAPTSGAGTAAAAAHPTLGRSWLGLAGLLLCAAVAGAWATGPLTDPALARWPRLLIDWQPALARHQPWRAFTAVGVHYSLLHLAANLAGGLLVAALGRVASLPLAATLAWAAAWPLTQIGLLLQPDLRHYGGLSGVLHAGVAVAGVFLVWQARGRRQAIGAALLAVMGLKLLSETPWAGPLQHPAGWDIAVAPLAHTSGALAGALCAALALGLQTLSRPTPAPDRPQ